MNLGPLQITDIKEKFIEKISEFNQKIQESALYNALLEYYQNLSQRSQRNLLLGVFGFLVFIIFLFPINRLISSSRHMKEYSANTQAINDLIQLNLGKKHFFEMSKLGSFEATKREVQVFLKRFKLLESQMAPITSYEVPKNFGPPLLKTLGLSVSLKTLNLKQVIDIGQKILTRSPQFKILSLEMKASSEKEFYFDVVFKIVKFGADEKLDSKKRKKKISMRW